MTIEEAVRNAMCGKCIPYRKETKGKLNEILQENAELKRLLKLAVDAIEKISEKSNGICLRSYYCEIKECDFDYDKIADVCKWKHKDEAMRLIGGDKNER